MTPHKIRRGSMGVPECSVCGAVMRPAGGGGGWVDFDNKLPLSEDCDEAGVQISVSKALASNTACIVCDILARDRDPEVAYAAAFGLGLACAGTLARTGRVNALPCCIEHLALLATAVACTGHPSETFLRLNRAGAKGDA